MKNIAVLLPVYKKDDPEYLHRAIDSLLCQSYQDFHIFVGVDGPIGDELAKCLSTPAYQDKITVIWFPENRGLACVLNDLIAVCKKESYAFFARMDADDVSVVNRLDDQIRFLTQHPDVDVVGGAISEIDENSKERGKTVIYPLTHEDCRRFFRYRDPLAHPSVMFRSRFFEKTAGYRAEYRKNQDTMLWYDGFMNGCVFANLPNVVLFFRVTNDFYNRRNGWQRAKQMLYDRIKINKSLHYDFTANLFAMGMFVMTISPSWIKKVLYKLR